MESDITGFQMSEKREQIVYSWIALRNAGFLDIRSSRYDITDMGLGDVPGWRLALGSPGAFRFFRGRFSAVSPR
jgi:hypothetical protein